MLKNEETYSTMKDIRLLRNIAIGIGIFVVTAFAVYQYVEQRDQIKQLTSDLQKANERIADQGETIQAGEKELKKREAEVEQKEAQLQAKESQLQDQLKQIQAQERELNSQKAEIARQQQTAATLRANNETLAACFGGVSLALIATTQVELLTAQGVMEENCKEATEIIENL